MRSQRTEAKQFRDEDEQVAQPSGSRKRETHGRIEAQTAADQDKAAFLNARRAGYKKRGAAECLNRRFEYDRFSEADFRTEKIKRQPDLERRGEALQRLPDEQITQDNRVSSPDQLNRLVDA
jgi:hypothetical protein